MSGSKVSGVLAFLVLLLLQAAPAHAQATRTWVSGVGDDANPCSRTAPCKTFAGAISKTAAGGEISVLDPGGFGAVTITKAITIMNDDSGEAGILASGTNGIVVNAGVNDVVILRGLVIDGGTPAVPGLNGIRFIAGAALHVERTLIKDFTGAAPNGHGINFAPSGVSELFVSNTTFINNGNLAATSGGGILIQPTGTGSAKVSLNRVQIENNRVGLQANSTTSTGAITVVMHDSTSNGSSNSAVAAVSAAAGGIPAQIVVSNSMVTNNATALTASGNAATIRIGNSVVSGNNAVINAVNSGTILSYKTNMIDGNTANNTPITAVGAATSPAGTN